jgi:hypothetical protein
MWRRAFIAAFVLLIVTSVFAVQPALAQNPVWHAEYYNNSDLRSPSVFTRNDASIAFNWGVNSPVSGIGSDNFSVRWATDVQLNPGTYRFYALADDNIRIVFNFVTYAPVIDTFASGQVNVLQSGDVTVSQAGTYHIQVDYREVTDQAFAYVSYANVATNPGGPNFAAPVPNPVSQNAWTAQYFGNSNLLGDPAAITTESAPVHDWGTGAPIGSVPADNFSARWTSAQYLSGGTYTISARADDGVRVYVNGTLVINEWHGASGQTYAVSLALPAGQNTFQVEYYEASGNAFIDFSINQTSGGGVVVPTAAPPVSGALATVTAYRLNVRNSPDPATGQIITRINRLETYAILGRNAASTWYLLNINGTQGWVSGGFINIANGANIPVVGAAATTAPITNATGNIVTATPYNVVIRSGPGTQYRRLGLLPVSGTAPLVGRNSSNTWWQVNFNGIVGWVSSQYAVIGSSANLSAVPVTG